MQLINSNDTALRRRISYSWFLQFRLLYTEICQSDTFNESLLRQTLSQFRMTLGRLRLGLHYFSLSQVHSQNCEKRLLDSSCLFIVRPYVRPHGTTWLPLDEFSPSEVSKAIFQMTSFTPLVSYAASVLRVGCRVRFARACISKWYACHYNARGELNVEGRNIIYKN